MKILPFSPQTTPDYLLWGAEVTVVQNNRQRKDGTPDLASFHLKELIWPGASSHAESWE